MDGGRNVAGALTPAGLRVERPGADPTRARPPGRRRLHRQRLGWAPTSDVRPRGQLRRWVWRCGTPLSVPTGCGAVGVGRPRPCWLDGGRQRPADPGRGAGGAARRPCAIPRSPRARGCPGIRVRPSCGGPMPGAHIPARPAERRRQRHADQVRRRLADLHRPSVRLRVQPGELAELLPADGISGGG